MSSFGFILVAQLSVYNNVIQWADKVDAQMENAEGWTYLGWLFLSFIVPEGNLLLIIMLMIIIIGVWIIRYRELNQGKSIEETLIKPLEEKTKNILFQIKMFIPFSDKKIELDRTDEMQNLKENLVEKQVIILSGEGGIGKTAIIKQLFEEKHEKDIFYVFKAIEFQDTNILYGHNIQEFIATHENFEKKIFVIDSAEKLLDIANTEFFNEFLSALIQNNWKIIFTTRYSYLDDLNYEFIENYQIKPYSIEIEKLSIAKLQEIGNQFEFNIPNDENLNELILNPFYLNEFLQAYNEGKEENYTDFRNKLWNKVIKKSDTNREECFLHLAFERARKGSFFLNSKCPKNSLKELLQDGILGKEVAGYFITHDIYEEWALERIIESKFINKVNEESFLKEIGSSLPIRRSFRNWVSEKLLLDNSDIKSFIENVIDNGHIAQFWKDETMISVLLSEYSDTFFENFEKELFEKNAILLQRISFLLRIACKEVDNSVLGSYKLTIDTLEVFSMFNKPKGLGWESFINIVFRHKDELGLQYIEFILPVLKEWQRNNQSGDITQKAAQLALHYYDLINKQEYKYSFNEHIKDLCDVVIAGSFEIQEELKTIFEQIITNKWKNHSDGYYKLSEMILTTEYGLPRAFLILKYFPDYVLKLADLFWTYIPKELPQGVLGGQERGKVETAFGIEKYGIPRYYPDSALQTPFYYQLKLHQNNTISFIIAFINKCVEKYSRSDWEEVIEVKVYFDDKMTINQYHSQALWNMYRGTSSQVMPNILKSIHMALEKYTLEVIKNSKQEDVEIFLKYLLMKSNSSSISAIVASAVLAYPDKTFNIAKILFKTKEFIQADLVRQIKDYSEVKFLYGIGYGLNYSTKVYADERLKTCEDKHRESHLESLFLNYQMFRSKEVSEDEADTRQKELWNILDNYYEQLPPKDEQVEMGKTWQMLLARIDKRKMDIQVKEVEKGFEIEFKGLLTPELEEYSKTSQKENSELFKYTSLTLWSKNRLENNQDYKKYKEFEETPLLALEQLKELVDTKAEERSPILRKEIFSDTSIILLRDFSDILEIEDKNLCKDIILEFASMPFQKNYNYQISDGSESAISNLPLVLNFYPELKDNIKIILLLNLFRDYEIGMSGTNVHDNAIDAIVKFYDEKEIDNFILGYLLLKPKYDVFYRELRQENYRIDELDVREKFFEKYNNDIEKFMDNKIEIEDINSNMNVYSLSVIMKFVKYSKVNNMVLFKNVSEEFILKIFQPKKKEEKHVDGLSKKELLEEMFSKNREEFEDIDLRIKQRFFDSFPYLIYKLEDKEIREYLQSLLDNFRDREDISYLLLEFIKIQDGEGKYDKFWYTWELFEDKIVEICKDGEYSYTNIIIQTYLLAWSPYGAIWNTKAKDWHTLKEKDKRFFKRMSQKIGYCPSTLYSISKLLTGIGSSYLNDGISWISYMVKNNKNLLTDELEPNTIFNLESITRKYVLQNSQEIKKQKVKKEELLEVLNFLIEKGSAIGYMLRERIL